MIGFLKGRIAAKHPPSLLLDVNGVGYEIDAPMSTFYNLPGTGEPASLFTHLVVREDAHVLYGFASEAERRLFRALLKVSGVGPKMALGILSGASVADFLRIVESEDTARLTRIPGIGRKTAERVIVEMRDSVGKFNAGAPIPPAPGVQGALPSAHGEAFSALVALGYKAPEVTRLLNGFNSAQMSTEELIRAALKAAARA